MKKTKNNLDEMQERKLLEIEHTACWMAFWSLIIAIFAQVAFLNGDFRNILGEEIVLLIISIYLTVACIKNGIWDRKLKPNLKTNLMLSFLSSLVFSGFCTFINYYKYNNHELIGSIIAFAFMFIFMFVMLLALLTFTTTIYKRKKHLMDQQADKEEKEE